MPNVNIVILAGNIVRDVELRFTPKGTAVGRVSIAVNRNWTNEQGQKMEESNFFDCDVFGKTAEVMAQYLHKGEPVLVSGRAKQDIWEDKQTKQKRSAVKFIIEKFEFLHSANGNSTPSRPAAPAASKPAQTRAVEQPNGSDTSDIPF